MKNPIRLNFRVDVVTEKKLRALAEETKLNMSEIIRLLVEKATAETLLEKKQA